MNETEIQNLVLYRDSLILVINKPAGIACHQGPSGGDYIEKYFNHLQYGLSAPPSLAHRLDRDTSGCLILGRNRKALAKLGKLFSGNLISKKYWAICHGKPTEAEGTINAPLLKINNKQGWRIVIDEKGQHSITDYKLLGYDEKSDLSWIEASPQTGRTHQIRIHLKHIGCPILGDPFYGHHRKDDEIIPSLNSLSLDGRGSSEARGEGENSPTPHPSLLPQGEKELNQLHLHARSVEIPISKNKPAIIVEAPAPLHMAKKLELFG